MNNNHDIPEGVLRFRDNIPDGYMHNIYELKSVDRDGNVTDIKYGKNLMTDFGLKNCWTYTLYICLGADQSAPSFSDLNMVSPFPNASTSPTIIDNFAKLQNIEYHPETHIVTMMYKVTQVMYEYNYSGITEPVDLYRLGVVPNSSSPSSNMIFSSAIYDEQGNVSYIRKKPNERLYVTVYLTSVTNIDLINTLWNQGKYLVHNFEYGIPTAKYGDRVFINFDGFNIKYTDTKGGHNTSSARLGYSNFGNTVQYSPSDPDQDFDPDEHTRTYRHSNTINVLIEDPQTNITGFVVGGADDPTDSGSSSFGGFMMLEYCVSRSTPEELVTDIAQTDDMFSADFNTIFKGGRHNDLSLRGLLPVADFTITGLKKYNFNTNEFDTNVPFVANPSLDFNTAHLCNPIDLRAGYPGISWQRSTSTGDVISGAVLVFANIHTEYEIKSIVPHGRSISSSDRYAVTDEYWNIESYQEIYDLSNVPSELSRKKYIIRLGGEYSAWLEVNYSKTPIQVGSTPYVPNKIDLTGRDTIYLHEYLDQNRHDLDAFITSEVDDYILFGEYVIFNPDDPSNTVKIPIERHLNVGVADSFYNSRYPDDNGNLLIFDGWANTSSYLGPQELCVYDMTDTTVQTLTPSTVIPISDVVLSNIAFTKHIATSNLGYASIQYAPDVVAKVIEYTGADPGVILTVTTDMGMIGRDSKYFVYHDSTDVATNTFVVYDCSTKTEVERFTFPTNVTYTNNALFVWKDHVYIRYTDSQNLTNVYYHKILSGSSQLVSLNGSYDVLYSFWCNSSASHRTGADKYKPFAKVIDDTCYIGTPLTYISGSDPVNLVQINHSDYAREGSSGWDITINTRYINIGLTTDTKTLLLGYSFQESYPLVMDLGQAIGLTVEGEQYIIHDIYRNSASGHTLVPYKDYIIDYYSPSSICRLLPYETMIPLQMTGTTYTLSAYNNPFRFSGNVDTSITVTNDMSKVYPATPPDPVILDNKYNVYDTYTGVTTQYDTQADAAAYIRAHTSDTFDVYMGSLVNTPAHDDSDYWDGVHLLSNTWNNMINLRKFVCNDLVNWVKDECFSGSSISEFVYTGIGSNPGVNGNHMVFGNRAFYGCTHLTTFTVEEGTLNHFEGDEIFANSGLTSISFPKTSYDMGCVSSIIGDDLFSGCTSLTSADIYIDESSIESPPQLVGMFKGCTSLQTITLDSDDVNAYELSNSTFQGTSNVQLTYYYWYESQKNGYPWGGTSVQVTYIQRT